jgi:hypothetical protein
MVGVEVSLQSFLTSALDGGEWSTSCPAALPLRKECRYPFYRRLGERQGWAGCFVEVENLLTWLGFEPRIVRRENVKERRK